MNDRDELDYEGEQYAPPPDRKQVHVFAPLFPFLLLSVIAVLIVLLTRSCHGGQSDFEHFLDALERVESQGCSTAIGDAGRARGPFQLWATAWEDVNRQRVRNGGRPVSYSTGSTNRAVARIFARDYLRLLHSKLSASLERQPTHSELYAAYNLGFQGFRRRAFYLSRCPLSTRRAASLITRALQTATAGVAKVRCSGGPRAVGVVRVVTDCACSPNRPDRQTLQWNS